MTAALYTLPVPTTVYECCAIALTIMVCMSIFFWWASHL